MSEQQSAGADGLKSDEPEPARAPGDYECRGCGAPLPFREGVCSASCAATGGPPYLYGSKRVPVGDRQVAATDGLGISRRTAWTIFSNPRDLWLYVAPLEPARFQLGICRGAPSNYRPLLTGGSFATRAEACDAIAWVLRTAVAIGTAELREQPETMTLERVDKLMDELRLVGNVCCV